MPPGNSPAAFARRAATVGPRMNEHVREGVRDAALIVTTVVRAELSRAGVRNGRLRGVGRKGARIGVGFDDKGLVNKKAASQLVKMRGPAHLIENPTKPHRIQPRRRGGKKAIVVNGQPVASVNHPGTRGKQPWRKGVNRSAPLAQRRVARAMTSSLAATFKR